MESRSDDGASGKLLASLAAPLLVVITALVYGVLSLAYGQFHAELGVRPADAGVEYGPGLGGAAGIVVLIVAGTAVATALIAVVWLAGWYAARRRQAGERAQEQSPVEPPPPIGSEVRGEQTAPEPSSVGEGRKDAEGDDRSGVALWQRVPRPTAWRVGLVAGVIALVLTVCIALFLVKGADTRADAVKEGQPLEPLRLIGIEVLSIRADLADVEVVRPQKATVATATTSDEIVAELDDRADDERPLFYLGRSGSSFVLYDSKNQRVFHIPTAIAVVQTHNCETDRRDSRCDEVLGRQTRNK